MMTISLILMTDVFLLIITEVLGDGGVWFIFLIKIKPVLTT